MRNNQGVGTIRRWCETSKKTPKTGFFHESSPTTSAKVFSAVIGRYYDVLRDRDSVRFRFPPKTSRGFTVIRPFPSRFSFRFRYTFYGTQVPPAARRARFSFFLTFFFFFLFEFSAVVRLSIVLFAAWPRARERPVQSSPDGRRPDVRSFPSRPLFSTPSPVVSVILQRDVFIRFSP